MVNRRDFKSKWKSRKSNWTSRKWWVNHEITDVWNVEDDWWQDWLD